MQLPDAKRHKAEDPKAVSSNVKVDEIHQRAIEKLKVRLETGDWILETEWRRPLMAWQPSTPGNPLCLLACSWTTSKRC